MRKIREVLRLRYEVGLSARQVAASVQMARSSVGEYQRRLAAAGLSWPLPEGLSDTALERTLFPPPPPVPSRARPVLDWALVHEELRRPGVTLMLLWEEYRAAHPQGFAYSWFCEHYRAWAGKLDLVMRQTHRAGEKLFVDYAGQTVEIIDRASGEVRTLSARFKAPSPRSELCGSARTPRAAPGRSSGGTAPATAPPAAATRV